MLVSGLYQSNSDIFIYSFSDSKFVVFFFDREGILGLDTARQGARITDCNAEGSHWSIELECGVSKYVFIHL